MLFCLDEDGMNVSGGMPNPMAGSHRRGNPDADPPGTIAVSGGEFVNTGSVLWQNHLNYPGSSALAITIKATSTQTHFKQNNSWSVG